MFKFIFAAITALFLMSGCSSTAVNVNTVHQLEKTNYLTSNEIKELLVDKEVKFTKTDGSKLLLNHQKDGSLTGLSVDANWEILEDGTKNIIVKGRVVSSVKIKKIVDKFYVIEGNEIKSTF